MKLLLLKIILLIVMGFVALICGIIPVKLYDFLKRKAKWEQHSSFVISLLSCFAGGVIVGVCLLDILPEARENSKSLNDYKFWKAFPFLELFIGIGFFVVYFLEEVIDRIFIHDMEIERERRMTLNFIPGDLSRVPSTISCKNHLNYGSTNSENTLTFRHDTGFSAETGPKDPAEAKKNLVSALTLVAALLIHTFLDGFAFGVQDSTISLTSLFFGIIVHKALVAFSVGLNLTEKLSDRRFLVVILVTILAVVSPFGGAIGMLIEGSDIPEKPKTVVVTILSCFSIGCFLFISFFDILAVERKNKHNNLLQWLACIIGFIAIGLFIYLAANDSDDDSAVTCPPSIATT